MFEPNRFGLKNVTLRFQQFHTSRLRSPLTRARASRIVRSLR